MKRPLAILGPALPFSPVPLQVYPHGARPVHLIITMIKWIRTGAGLLLLDYSQA